MGESEAEVWLLVRSATNRRLLAEFVAGQGARARELASLEELDCALESAAQTPGCTAIIDLSGFPAAVLERCQRLRELNVPFVLVSNPEDSQRALARGRRHGVDRVLTKPLRKAALEAALRQLAGL